MKSITLTNSDETIRVSDEDFDYLNQFAWKLIKTGFGYEQIVRCYAPDERHDRMTHSLLHTVARLMGLVAADDEVISAISRDDFDCTRSNVMKRKRNRMAKLNGLTYVTVEGRWRLRINFSNDETFVGWYTHEYEALDVYDRLTLAMGANNEKN